MILASVARAMLPLLLVFSLFLLWRGHNEPGGGFTGGLVAAAGFALYAMAFQPRSVRRVIRVDLRTLMGAGLLCAAAAGVIGMAQGKPFMTGVWISWHGPEGIAVEIGTPFLFDVGVYLVVLSVTLSIILSKAEER
ncbi:MAG: hypothetical protein AMXMBFR81_30130 [Chthonomonas sp.]